MAETGSKTVMNASQCLWNMGCATKQLWLLVLARTSHNLSLLQGIGNNCYFEHLFTNIYILIVSSLVTQAWSLFKDITFFFLFFFTNLNISFFSNYYFSWCPQRSAGMVLDFWSSESGFKVWAQTVTFFCGIKNPL